jgi:hypothetical protein
MLHALVDSLTPYSRRFLFEGQLVNLFPLWREQCLIIVPLAPIDSAPQWLARVVPLCLQKCFRFSICTGNGLKRLKAWPEHNFVPKRFLDGIFFQKLVSSQVMA